MRDETIERLERDGEIAVIYSPGFGSGWSTWSGYPATFMFDKVMAECVERGDRDGVVARAKEIDPDCHIGSNVNALTLRWVPKGARVRIDEYDGSESVVVNPEDYEIA